jgi:hypothetical protein
VQISDIPDELDAHRLRHGSREERTSAAADSTSLRLPEVVGPLMKLHHVGTEHLHLHSIPSTEENRREIEQGRMSQTPSLAPCCRVHRVTSFTSTVGSPPPRRLHRGESPKTAARLGASHSFPSTVGSPPPRRLRRGESPKTDRRSPRRLLLLPLHRGKPATTPTPPWGDPKTAARLGASLPLP